MLSIVPTMHAISHQTDWVVTVWIHMLIFLLPAVAYSRIPAIRRKLHFDRTDREENVALAAYS
jgi:hypothetical protein